MPTFSELPLSPALAGALSDLGFTEPTPIQAEALPALLAGRDLRGRARAGRPGTAITLVSDRQAERVAGWVAVGPAPEGEGPVLGSDRRTIAFGAGRKDKLRPGDVLGALTGAGGLRPDQVGRIVVGERRAWVGVDAEAAEEVARRLARGQVKGRRMWVGVI
jgi:ATP-independent RNA helicase DbpA